MRIVNEPTAAAIAYGLDAKSKDRKGTGAAACLHLSDQKTLDPRARMCRCATYPASGIRSCDDSYSSSCHVSVFRDSFAK